MGTPITYLSGGTMGYQSGVFKNSTTALGFTFPLTSGYRWWNGVDVSASQYLLYSDLNSVGQATVANSRPTAWSTPDLTDQSLLNLINTLPERVGLPGFTSLSAAYQWLQNSETYFLIRNSIESIIQGDLQMYYDGGWYTSYAGTGTAVTDLSGNARTGTLYNGTSFNSSGVGAFSFDGTDDYMECPSFNVNAQNEFTLDAWINLNAVSGSYSIIKKNTSNEDWPIFQLSVVGGDLQGYYSSTVYGQCLEGAYTTNDPIQAGVWYHVAYSKGTAGYTSMKLYINGISVPYSNSLYGTHINSLASSTKPIHIGRSLDGPNWIQPFNGLIPITRIYNKQLSDTEILQNYNAQKGRFGITSPVQNGMVLQLDAANPASYPGAGNTRSFIQAKIYSSYDGGLRSSNYTVQCSDDNVNWTTAFVGVCSNNNSCGIQVNTGTGTGIYGRYWRYVEGSAIAGHHPRCSRIILTDINGIDNNLIVYAADNCSDIGDYIIGTVSKDFGGIVTETWNDISGYGNNGTLTNGPTFSSANGGSISFDGADDRVSTGFKPSGYRSYLVWVKYNIITGLSNGYALTGTQENNAYNYLGISNGGYFYYYFGTNGEQINTTVLSATVWYQQCVTLSSDGYARAYLNGVLVSTLSSGVGNTATNEFSVGCVNQNHFVNGLISNVTQYNRTLSAPEIQQNFYALADRYGVGIVRNGLVLNVDAGNFASYPTSGTTWYDLSGNVNDGVLTNGPTYSTSNGGALIFDGVDDYVNLGNTIDFASSQFSAGFTIELWVNPKVTTANSALFSSAQGSSGGEWQLYIWYNTDQKFGTAQRYSGSQNDFQTSNTYAPDNWYHLVVTSNNTTCRIYVNAVEQNNNGTGQPNNQPSGREVRIASFKNYNFSQSTTAICRVYNKALTSGNVTTNFNADKGRYGL